MWQMDKANCGIFLQQVILSNNKGTNIDTLKTMNECKIHYAKLKKPNTKKTPTV